MTTQNTVTHRDALKRQIAEVRRKIEIAQQRTVEPEVLTAAIEQARRDLDALTSPVLEDLRETAEKLADDIEHNWLSLCRTTLMADTMADKAPTVPVPETLINAIGAAITARPHLLDQLRAADIDTIDLPVLPPYRHLKSEADHGTR